MSIVGPHNKLIVQEGIKRICAKAVTSVTELAYHLISKIKISQNHVQ